MEITVNGEIIPSTLIEQEKERLHMDPASPPYDELEDIVVDTLIARTLIRQKASNSDVAIPADEITASLDDLIEEAGSKDLFYRRYGITDDQENLVKNEIEITLKVERLLHEIAKNLEEPTPAEIEAFYNKHKEELTQPEEADALHIVMNVCCEDEAPATYEKMRSVRDAVLAGEDFEQLAKENTTDEQGAHLGPFKRGDMAPEFEAIAFSMNPGEISPIFQTQFGYHLVKIIDRKKQRHLTLEEASPGIAKQLVHEKENALVEQWVAAEKEKAEIAVVED